MEYFHYQFRGVLHYLSIMIVQCLYQFFWSTFVMPWRLAIVASPALLSFVGPIHVCHLNVKHEFVADVPNIVKRIITIKIIEY